MTTSLSHSSDYSLIVAKLAADPASTAEHADALLKIAQDFIESARLAEESADLQAQLEATPDNFRLIEARKNNAVASLKLAMLDLPRIDLPAYVENLRRSVLVALPPYQVEGRPEQVAAARQAGQMIRDTVWAQQPLTDDVWARTLQRFIARRLARLAATKRDGAGSIIEELQGQWTRVAETAAVLAMERKAVAEIRTLPEDAAKPFRRALSIALNTAKQGTGNALIDKFAFHDGPMANTMRSYKLAELDPFLIAIDQLFNLAAHFRMYAHTLDGLRSILGVPATGTKPIHAETIELTEWAKAHGVGRRALARRLVEAGFPPDTDPASPRDANLATDSSRAEEAIAVWENRLKSYW